LLKSSTISTGYRLPVAGARVTLHPLMVSDFAPAAAVKQPAKSISDMELITTEVVLILFMSFLNFRGTKESGVVQRFCVSFATP
jgi:amino acid transporter